MTHPTATGAGLNLGSCRKPYGSVKFCVYIKVGCGGVFIFVRRKLSNASALELHPPNWYLLDYSGNGASVIALALAQRARRCPVLLESHILCTSSASGGERSGAPDDRGRWERSPFFGRSMWEKNAAERLTYQALRTVVAKSLRYSTIFASLRLSLRLIILMSSHSCRCSFPHFANRRRTNWLSLRLRHPRWQPTVPGFAKS